MKFSLEPLQNITVGFSATLYTTSEDQGSVEISIIISEPTSGGAPRPFSLSLTTQDNTAGVLAPFCYC